ncbi:hypothetical protein GLAREA_00568 [Glarea lozoyensis ATCC 20868]|uniref:Uncharacterized protein n=1 Tax=Glarea lozoyensis (strain ATCC 20868 / MF5171) TaxID=1116229 RepID=S3DSK7_GLAL2|nr:uncharacterized protein GLAREA_00568 [Glarea lozoyensis ATCC 20868]EPE29408.1 hypothetical protein GLAREA_00568 [Glarea lozoyensis ATCC 20868]
MYNKANFAYRKRYLKSPPARSIAVRSCAVRELESRRWLLIRPSFLREGNANTVRIISTLGRKYYAGDFGSHVNSSTRIRSGDGRIEFEQLRRAKTAIAIVMSHSGRTEQTEQVLQS